MKANKMKKILPLLISLIIFLSPLAAFARTYTIFVDAGSTGSRLHVYQINQSIVIPEVIDIFSISTTPGLSSFAAHPEKSGESLKVLFDGATQFLQNQHIDLREVSVHVLATAGMRLLPENQQRAIYSNVTDYLKAHYAYPLKNVKTISGQMEGVYGWLDVNYLLGNFQHHQPTVGSIEMGGASTQIAFATTDHSKPQDEIIVNIGNQSYRVFSKSFLGLGQEQIIETMTKDQAAENCYPQNYIFNPQKNRTF